MMAVVFATLALAPPLFLIAYQIGRVADAIRRRTQAPNTRGEDE